MLVIRLKRVGRSGYAQFRVVVQDVRQSPKSGQVVAVLGSFDPHTKAINIDAEKTNLYLKNGAQPSDRMAILLKKQGIKLPKWVIAATTKKKAIRSTEKLRKNRTPEPKAPAAEAETTTDAPADDEAVAETEVTTETPAETEAVVDEVATKEVAEKVEAEEKTPEAEVEVSKATDEDVKA